MSNAPEFNRFIKRLDAYMEARSMNDRQLSLMAGASADYVNKLRKRKSIPKLAFLERIAKALGVPASSLSPEAPMPDLDGSSRRKVGGKQTITRNINDLELLAELAEILLQAIVRNDLVARSVSQSLVLVYEAARERGLRPQDRGELELLLETEVRRLASLTA